MESRPVVVVSNRGPSSFVLDDDRVRPGSPSGGLARGLRPLVAATGGTWFACAVSEADRAAALLPRPDPDIDLRLLAVDPVVYGPAYDTIANGTLWFLHHSLWDLPRRPRFDAQWHRAWHAYEILNTTMAEQIVASAPANAVVLVQDYHFALMAPELVDRRPDLDLVHFSHTPFAGPESITVLPTGPAATYLSGMAAYGACGFHTERWRRRFLQSCEELGVAAPRTFVSPLPPDAAGIRELAESTAGTDNLAALEERLADRRLVLTSGRLELSKNLQRAMFAFEELLVRRPDLRGDVVFAAFVYASRESLVEYQSYRQECEGTAQRINARFATPDWQPIWFETDDNLPRSIAGLRRYDVLLINPIRDGLNLVAFEGPLVNERDGVVALSRETGAAALLENAALLLHPFDIDNTASVIARALDLNHDDRTRRAKQLVAISERRSVTDWLNDQLNALG